MDDNGDKVEKVVKDNPLGQPANVDDEISLDRFLQLAGMEQSQLEALCGPSRGDSSIPVQTRRPFQETLERFSPDYLHKVEDESASHRRKLAAYQESQEKQAQMIQKLQSKHQTTTENLNTRVNAAEARVRAVEQDRAFEMESATAKLHEEQERVAELTRANELLRDQLDQAVQANQGLSQDVARLTLAWRHAAQQLDKRETEWREEENAFNDYFAAEHSRLLALWRAVVGLRRQFGDLRQQTDRDLTQARGEFERHIRQVQSVCGNLEVNLRVAEAQQQANWKKESKNASVHEAEAAERIRSLTESLNRSQTKLAEIESLLTESNAARERLSMQLADRDRILNTMKQLRSGVLSVEHGKRRAGKLLEHKRSKKYLHMDHQSSEEEAEKQLLVEEFEKTESDSEDHLRATKILIEHTHVMHQALSQIAQLVISDCLIADSDEADEPGLQLSTPDKSFIQESKASHLEEPLTIYVRSDQDGTSPVTNLKDKAESDQPIHGISSTDMAHLRSLAHSKYRAGSSPHLAESTVSAVQSTLNRRAAHVHRLRYRNHGLKDQVQNLIRRTEELEQEKRRTAEHLGRLREELSTQSLEMDKVVRERDRVKHNLSITMEERQMSETTRMNMADQIRDLQTELERIRSANFEAVKQRDEVSGEREKLQVEYDRAIRESGVIKASLESVEQRAASYREELAAMRESLRRMELARDVLDQEKAEAVTSANRVQNKVISLEQKLIQYQLQESQLKERIAELELTVETQDRDNQHLTQQNALAHSNELRLNEERSSLRAEIQQLREELDRLYAERGSLNSEAEQAKESAARLEATKKRLEAETSDLTQERLTLIEALNCAERQKAALLEDLNSFRKDSERQANLLNRLNKEKETLSKQKAELFIQVSILERDAREHLDDICRLREEKETLESNLFDSHQMIEELQEKQAGHEREIAELKLRKETLQAELLKAHTNFQVELDKSQRNTQHLGNQLNTEVAGLRQQLAQAEHRAKEAEDACVQAVARADQAIAAMGRHQKLEAESTTDRDFELKKSAEEVSRLTRALLIAQSERDEARLQTEQEHQRAMLQALEEKSGLQERVVQLQHTITELQDALDRTHQESDFRVDHDRLALKRANEEIRAFRNQMDESRLEHERVLREVRIRTEDLEAQRDQLIKENSELHLKIRLSENTREGSRNDLLDSTQRMHAAEEAIEAVRRDCIELRQKLTEAEREKSALDAANEELRRQMRHLEDERVELLRVSNMTRTQLQDTEMERHAAEKRAAELQENIRLASVSSTEARRTMSEMKLQQKKLLFEKEALQQEVNELRNQLTEARSIGENFKREKNVLKHRLADMEGLRTTLQDDVNTLTKQVTELEEIMRSRERATNQAADEWHQDYYRMDKIRQELEQRIEQCNLVIGELRASLAETQAHLRGVENELSETLVARQEAEARLSAIHSILRRMLGFRQSQYSERLMENMDRYRYLLSSSGSPLDFIDYLSDENKTKQPALEQQLSSPERNRQTTWRTLTNRENQEERDERELRRVADKVLGNKIYNNSASPPKPRQRSRRRFLEDTERQMFRPHMSYFKSKRAKSSSPPRDRRPSWCIRPTSVERPSESRETDTAYQVDGEDALIGSPSWLRMTQMRLLGFHCRGLPGSDLDPEAVRMVIRDFLKHLVAVERDRDTKAIELKSLEGRVNELQNELKVCEEEKTKCRTNLTEMEKDKKEVLVRLDAMKHAISEQELYFSKKEKECETLRFKLHSAERDLTLCETERKQLQDQLTKMKSIELRSTDDRHQLLRVLDDAENRLTDTEVARRRIEGEMKRLQTELGTTEKEKKELQTRIENLVGHKADLEKKVQSMQSEITHLSSQLEQENEKVIEAHAKLELERGSQMELKNELNQLRDQLEVARHRDAAHEQENILLKEKVETQQRSILQAKAQLNETTGSLRQLQENASRDELQRTELQYQVNQQLDQIAQLKNTIKDLQIELKSTRNENLSSNEKHSKLLRETNDLSLVKHELEAEVQRLQKINSQAKKALEKLDKERTRDQEIAIKLQAENQELLSSVQRMENENIDLRREIQKMQVLLAQRTDAQTARLTEANAKQKLELQTELDRQRIALEQAEQNLKTKERSHHVRVRGLEEQVAFLKDQLTQEMNRRQLFITKPSSMTSEVSGTAQHTSSPTITEAELADTRMRIDQSLPQETYLPGQYKPTICPSRYDPYFYQVTGSIPASLDRIRTRTIAKRAKAGPCMDERKQDNSQELTSLPFSRSFITGSVRVPSRYASTALARKGISHSQSATTIGRQVSGDEER